MKEFQEGTPFERRHNLPAQLTSFVGREGEIEAVKRLLRTNRLLTLTGPGGTGKTRLALTVGSELVDDFEDGVFFVNLAPLGTAELVLSTIAHTLGIREEGKQPLEERLKAHLEKKQLLLILDNFEHLLKAAPLVSELLVAAPHLKVLTTSRIALYLYGEQEFPVPPLQLPGARPLPPLERLSQYEAVRLFIQRARAVKPDFEINNENAPAVAEICYRLDGLPLAIELAAARSKLLSPETLLARLESRLKLLTGRALDVPDRQQTLRATIEWSYNLLEEGEQQVFRRLAVFHGGWTLEAAEAVCVGDLDVDVLAEMEGLLDKSLLKAAEEDGDALRFVMLQTIREYAREQLAASGEAERMRHAHADYYLALAEAASEAVAAGQLDQLKAEHDNLRAALRFYFDQNDIESLMHLTVVLQGFWELSGFYEEWRKWSEAAVAASQDLPQLDGARGWCLYSAGWAAFRQGDFSRSLALAEEALALFRELGEREGVASALELMAGHALDDGDYEAGRAFMEEVLALNWELGREQETVTSLINLATLYLASGEPEHVEPLISEALSLIEKSGEQYSETLAVLVLGDTRMLQGDSEGAEALYRQCLESMKGTYHYFIVHYALFGISRVAAQRGQAERAARLLGVTEEFRRTTGLALLPAFKPLYEQIWNDMQEQLGEETFVTVIDEGRQMAVEDAVAYALESPMAEDRQVRSTALQASLDHPAGLTPREVEVLSLVAQGMTDAQVAEELVISPRTVNAHLTSIYSKLDVNSRVAATLVAQEHGLV